MKCPEFFGSAHNMLLKHSLSLSGNCMLRGGRAGWSSGTRDRGREEGADENVCGFTIAGNRPSAAANEALTLLTYFPVRFSFGGKNGR